MLDLSVKNFFGFDLSGYDKIGISASAGTDSTSVFYLLAKYVNKPIYPIHGVDIHRPNSISHINDIHLTIKNFFPNADIKDIEFFEYDIKPQPHLCIFCKNNDAPNHYRALADVMFEKGETEGIAPGGFAKRLAHNEGYEAAAKKYNIPIIAFGMTATPPLDVMEKLGMPYEKRRLDYRAQSPRLTTSSTPYHHLHPLINEDKSYVAKIYKHYDIMETLFPLTSSCIGFSEDTNGFTEPCKKCYWCYEKKWAFGTYDL